MAIDLTPSADRKLVELVSVSGHDSRELVSQAVEHLHRTLIGLRDTDPAAPDVDTGPFRKELSFQPAEIVLRQVDPTSFQLEEPFRYIGEDGTPEWTVRETDVSDLASVPSFLTWLVPRYGRHTLAALLHDHLQDQSIDNPVSSARADEVFRDAMAETGVPLLLRWMMWAAVSARTRKNHGGLVMALTLLWVGAYALLGCLGPPVLLAALLTGGLSPSAGLVLAVATVLSPFVLAVIWGRDYRFGVLAGVGVLLIGYAALVDVMVYAVYASLETASRLFQAHPKPIRATKLKLEQSAGASR